MPKYLWQATYTAEGIRGLMKDGGTARRAAIEAAAASQGGSIEAVYWAFGDNDVYVIAEAPSNADAAAISLAVGAAGAVQIRTAVLLTAEEIDQATGASVDYRPPGA